MCMQVANGMSALHECGLVHGNLKTSNLLIDNDGECLECAASCSFGCMGILFDCREMLSGPHAHACMRQRSPTHALTMRLYAE